MSTPKKMKKNVKLVKEEMRSGKRKTLYSNILVIKWEILWVKFEGVL